MLQTRHFSNRLLANKLGRTFSTNWRSSSTKIFGAQFLPIQSTNGCPSRCIILPKFKEQICQRHQFCSTTADGGSIPPSNQLNANSSSSQIQSSKMATDFTKEKIPNKILEYRQLKLDEFGDKNMKIFIKEFGSTGRKCFKIMYFNKKLSYIPYIPMPEDAYAFVRAMDNLMGELVSGNIDPHKYKGPLTTAQSIAAHDSANSNQMVELGVFEFTGQTRKFQLGLVLFPADDKGKGRICFQTRISSPLKSENGKWSYLTLPLHALPWLRREMAKIMAKYDGKEQIGEAPQIPQKFFNRRNDDANNSPPLSSISIPSTKMQIINAEKMKMPSRIIAQRTLDLNKFHNKFLRLCLIEGSGSKEKFFQIMIINNGHGQYSKFPILLVPQDAYAFVGAMDELIGELAVENFDVQKFIDKHQSAIESAVDEKNDGFKQKHAALKFAEFTGQTHKFQLELVHFPNANQINGKIEIFLQMDSFELSTKKRNWILLPLHAFPWLRAEMAEMLIKCDGKEQIGEAAQIKSLWNDVPRFATQKFNFDGKSNGQMRPKIEDKIPPKMPTTFPSEQKYSKMEPKIQKNNSNRIWNKNQPEMGAAQFDPQIAEVEQSLRDAILDTKQMRNKRAPRKIEDPMNPTMADLEESLRILFDFEEEKEDSSRGKKYGREAANNGRRKFPRYEF